MRVVDVGCGPGRLTIRIARVVGSTGEVLGIDIDAKALRAAERRAARAGLRNVRFMQAGAGEGKLGEGRFDRAVLVAVLGEIRDRHAAMADQFRALEPGGILSVTEVAFDPHRRSPDDVRRLAGSAGFEEQAYVDAPLVFTINFRKPAPG